MQSVARALQRSRLAGGQEFPHVPEFQPLYDLGWAPRYGEMAAITARSGSGKSTLVDDILRRALCRELYGSKEHPGRFREIKGMDRVDKAVVIDQSPIGRTPRSNPATYTGVFTPVRELFAGVP